jgi:putative transposase
VGIRVIDASRKIKAKQKVTRYLEQVSDARLSWNDPVGRLAMIQELIPLGLMAVESALQSDVMELVGARMNRGGDLVRWGSNPGSVFLGEQKVPIRVPRVRNRAAGIEVPLSSYEGLQNPARVDDSVFRKMIHGISAGNYERAAGHLPEAFGMKPSSVSRRFMRAAKAQFKKLAERDLSEYDLVAVIVDGKAFGDNEIIIAVGITVDGDKIILGFIESATEHHLVCEKLIDDLASRGLRVDQELLFVIDGSKGLRKGIKKALGSNALIQRCQWHKREDVVSYLPKNLRDQFRKKLQSAYREVTEAKARKALERIGRELKLINVSAYNSLMEGLDETLTLHRLGISGVLAKSLRTTNGIESVNSLLGQYTDRVDYWKNSDQRQRWVATALLEIEPRLNRIRGHVQLPQLRKAMKRFVTQFPAKQPVQDVA